MEKRIELEMRGRPAGEITNLNLDNCRSTQVSGLTDEFINLENLSMINVGLTSLKGFPKLPQLRRLELSDNRLTGGFENLAGCPNLKALNFSGNKIKDVKALEPLKPLSNLKSLDLFNCEITNLDNYRVETFEALPRLKYLDGFDREDAEADETDEDSLGSDEEDEEDDDFDGEDEVGSEASDQSDEDEESGDLDDEEAESDDDVKIVNGDHKPVKEEDTGARGKKRKHEDDSE